MCVIIVKRKGTEPPSPDVLKQCWDSNPDGAGYAVWDGKAGMAFIDKGYMEFDGFADAVAKAKIGKNDLAMYHFRIGTSGGKGPGQTHPFPVDTDEGMLAALTAMSKSAVAHNGVFRWDGYNSHPTLSDSMLFTRDYLAHPNARDYLSHPKVVKAIGKAIEGSRLAVMTKGQLLTIGHGWHKDRDSGLWFSNKNWDWPRYSSSRKSYGYDPMPKYEPFAGGYGSFADNIPVRTTEKGMGFEFCKNAERYCEYMDGDRCWADEMNYSCFMDDARLEGRGIIY